MPHAQALRSGQIGAQLSKSFIRLTCPLQTQSIPLNRYRPKPAKIGSFRNSLQTHSTVSSDIEYLREKAGIVEKLEAVMPEVETKGSLNPFIDDIKTPLIVAATLLKEAVSILETVWADSDEYSTRVVPLKFEEDAAVLVVWEVLKALEIAPFMYSVALAMHYLGYEPLIPKSTNRDNSIVNKWFSRHKRAKPKWAKMVEQLNELVRSACSECPDDLLELLPGLKDDLLASTQNISHGIPGITNEIGAIGSKCHSLTGPRPNQGGQR